MTSATNSALDLDALTAFVDERLPGLRHGPLEAVQFAGGRSNLTYRITDGSESWVLRRPPLGHVLETAHDMSREYRVMNGLAGTDVPVPRMLAECTDPTVIGATFYLMEFADGTIFKTTAQLRELSSEQGQSLGAGLIEALAALHAVDADAVGLGELGRPEGYLARQVARWRKQFTASMSRDLPGADELADRLAATVPVTQRSAIVHGDYRLENIVMRTDDFGRVRAMLDWEMATLGDPLTDLANVLAWWDGFTAPDDPMGAVPGQVPGFPTGSELTTIYAGRTGLDVSDFAWYQGMAYYKLAAIFEGIYYRDVQGLTVGEGFDDIGVLTVPLIELGHAALG